MLVGRAPQEFLLPFLRLHISTNLLLSLWSKDAFDFCKPYQGFLRKTGRLVSSPTETGLPIFPPAHRFVRAFGPTVRRRRAIFLVRPY